MKRVIAISLMCILSSCATTDSKDASKMSQATPSKSGFDDGYMAKVESQATQRGVVVRWVHPPKAPKAKKDGQ
ncbi:MAG TPA: hypothetical protein PLF92_08660 [Arenimonas sp.]|mgnify:FL=1|nr:hypothetical protein [Arenimonas sp.]HOZ04433.1 hypothetical protein [Arenimonas sp.]HPO24256.1 hypothetical protein [Arenimonas sp.]HPW32966.1 hypothetical protein [Arenimonas sp.]